MTHHWHGCATWVPTSYSWASAGKSCTAFHLAEYSAELWQPAEYGCAIGHGRDRRWMTYSDASLDDRDLACLVTPSIPAGTTVRHGVAGQATALRFPLREAVKFALTWMTHNRVHR